MKLSLIRLQDYRNIAFAEMRFGDGLSHLFYGNNGQGKTNLLEAIHFLTALRSFRIHEQRYLIQQNKSAAHVYVELEHELLGQSAVRILLKPNGKEIFLENTRITRLSEIIGRFPTVMMSSQDTQLIRGAPAFRRRFMDLMLSSVDLEYLEALKHYTLALEERNRLLKSIAANNTSSQHAVLRAFEDQMIPSGLTLFRKRTQLFITFDRYLKEYYSRIATSNETPEIQYQSDFSNPSTSFTENDYRLFLEKNRERDFFIKSTHRGPHHDDFILNLNNNPAKNYASEGQQRGLLLALRLAQIAFSKDITGIMPIVLADDVLGELDSIRKERFWSALPSEIQLLATATQTLEDTHRNWAHWNVQSGNFLPQHQLSAVI